MTRFKLTQEGTDILSPFEKETDWVRRMECINTMMRESLYDKTGANSHFGQALEQAHMDYVSEIPPPVEGDEWQSLGGNEKCPIQGLTLHYPTEAPPLPSSVKTSTYVAFDVEDNVTGASGPMPVRSVHVLTLQGHPEYNASVMQDVLSFVHASGLINEKEFHDGQVRANEKQQNLETAKILLGMLGMEPATVDIDPMAQ